MPDLGEKFTKLSFKDWSPLNEKEINSLSGPNEKFFFESLDGSYPFIVNLLSINIKNYNYLNLKYKSSKDIEQKKLPFIIGVTGSVASGKSTFSKIIKSLLKKSFKEIVPPGIPGIWKSFFEAQAMWTSKALSAN